MSRSIALPLVGDLTKHTTGALRLKASHGNTHNLGGDDFDRLLMDLADDLFFEQHGVRLKSDLKAANRLWSAVEKAKRELSDASYARIREEFILNNLHLDLEIARTDYEEMIRPLLDKTMDTTTGLAPRT